MNFLHRANYCITSTLPRDPSQTAQSQLARALVDALVTGFAEDPALALGPNAGSS